MNYDTYDLIAYLCQVPNDLDEKELEALFYDKYDIDTYSFENLIRDLVPLCTIAKSDLTNVVYRGFGIDSLWLVRKEVKKNDLFSNKSNSII